MGTATCTISGSGFSAITLRQLSTGLDDPYSPTPSDISQSASRELADHPVPGLNRDIGQDMGSHSKEFGIGGLCTKSDMDAIILRYEADQFPYNAPGGRWTLVMTDSDSVVWFSQSGLAMKSYLFTGKGGIRKHVRYTIIFRCYLGQT